MMHKLFTEGIGHTEFKDTEIGRIPKEWNVVTLGIILEMKNGERPVTSETSLFPIYGANGVIGHTNVYLVDNDFTIVIGRVGAAGEIQLVKGKAWISDNAIYSKNYDKSKVYMPFLFYLLKSKSLTKFASKTTHPIITQTFLKNFLVQCPELFEQQKIAYVLSKIQKAIELQDRLIKLLQE
ncbi:MAG: restriction endonuclease subunit S, partial [Caldisericum sp.]|uniref:restriction endonuclease subunit S n=1 Tax=Caldisericum sp. TaxID=2499687 RepID=UPI003D0DBA2B